MSYQPSWLDREQFAQEQQNFGERPTPSALSPTHTRSTRVQHDYMNQDAPLALQPDRQPFHDGDHLHFEPTTSARYAAAGTALSPSASMRLSTPQPVLGAGSVYASGPLTLGHTGGFGAAVSNDPAAYHGTNASLSPTRLSGSGGLTLRKSASPVPQLMGTQAGFAVVTSPLAMSQSSPGVLASTASLHPLATSNYVDVNHLQLELEHRELQDARSLRFSDPVLGRIGAPRLTTSSFAPSYAGPPVAEPMPLAMAAPGPYTMRPGEEPKRVQTRSMTTRNYLIPWDDSTCTIPNFWVSLISFFLMICAMCFAIAGATGVWSHSHRVEVGRSGAVSWRYDQEYNYYLSHYVPVGAPNNVTDYANALDFRSGCNDNLHSTAVSLSFGIILCAPAAFFLLRGIRFPCLWRLYEQKRFVRLFTYLTSLAVFFLFCTSCASWIFGCHNVLVQNEVQTNMVTAVRNVDTTVQLGWGFWLVFGSIMSSVFATSLQMCFDSHSSSPKSWLP